jgi:hypothetical protein
VGVVVYVFEPVVRTRRLVLHLDADGRLCAGSP